MGIFDKRSDTEKEIDRYNRTRTTDNYRNSAYGSSNYDNYSNNSSYGSNNNNVNNNSYNKSYNPNSYGMPNNNGYNQNNDMPNNYNGYNPNNGMPNNNGYNPNNCTPNNYNGYNPNSNGMPNNYNGYNPNSNGMPNNYNGYNPNNGMPNNYNGYRQNYYQNNGYGMNNPLNQHNPNRVYVKPPKSNKAVPVIFFATFFLIMFAPFLLSKFATSIDFVIIIPLLFSALFTLLGLAVAFVPFITAGIKKRRCKTQLKALVVDMKSRRGSKGRRVYAPVYQYFYGGKEYITTASVYRNYSLPDIGDEVNMLINETNPEDFYVDDTRGNLTTLVVGLIFAAFPLLMFFSAR